MAATVIEQLLCSCSGHIISCSVFYSSNLVGATRFMRRSTTVLFFIARVRYCDIVITYTRAESPKQFQQFMNRG